MKCITLGFLLMTLVFSSSKGNAQTTITGFTPFLSTILRSISNGKTIAMQSLLLEYWAVVH
jgi:hypothetical protein